MQGRRGSRPGFSGSAGTRVFHGFSAFENSKISFSKYYKRFRPCVDVHLAVNLYIWSLSRQHIDFMYFFPDTKQQRRKLNLLSTINHCDQMANLHI